MELVVRGRLNKKIFCYSCKSSPKGDKSGGPLDLPTDASGWVVRQGEDRHCPINRGNPSLSLPRDLGKEVLPEVPPTGKSRQGREKQSQPASWLLIPGGLPQEDFQMAFSHSGSRFGLQITREGLVRSPSH